ncbi:MAG: cobyric acid synthase [Lachnoclostridium sp.]|nr:cobyric acid synthase [Lachnospira sp.]MCM1247175.1 cobyric acid synthase [Lachnoclostridium sp.]MCM1534604.1 cobyric acid synthase [Clostridium sp.]
MAKVIMVQGTMSGAGKSLITAGLCRIFKQDGFRTAPFKSQNMALNSFVTSENLEMGRAQVIQAEAAGIEPKVCMNPILLKPNNHTGSQVIVNGEVLGNMSARDYFAYKKHLIPDIKNAFRKLEEFADIIVIEGAGSPAEINLKENDIVNMGLAGMVDAPVLLVGDIDRGGVFAQLLGTLLLLSDSERDRVKGLIINKFRGDKALLEPGIQMLYEKGKVPVTGVVPYMELFLEDEDSLTERFHKKRKGFIDIAVIRYPRISNFTDFNIFEQIEEVTVRYVTCVNDLQRPDLIFLPGSKNVMSDLWWMRQNGLEAAVKKLAGEIPIFGVCGGYQMLGCEIADPDSVEEGGSLRGMELLGVKTVLQKEKKRCQTAGKIEELAGIFKGLSGCPFKGYEIHMGRTFDMREGAAEVKKKVVCDAEKNVYGSYVHGLFDQGSAADIVVQALAEGKGITIESGSFENYRAFKEKQYDKLADTLRKYLNMEEIYGMLREARLE